MANTKNLLIGMIESNSLGSIQGLCLLAMIHFEKNDVNLAWAYSGMATRASLGLRLNVDGETLEKPLEWLESESRRRCWWACFKLVKC